ncbi:MAG: RNA methyltransferase [Gemmatimonadota bacterium]|jgi:TrmH family RNA methyltransferase|nr:rRNA methyltransferase [Gemmatimonadota bacterium]MDP6462031.1 RNA methyltransferase [Gemmatimonadota bacterium]MDP6529166.1 RNA methyltransferase [Gemmatimonadota bacterium]MDP6802855.1 RNA methyltransferase [Gemmatimonadota bacterium]MDP7032199.1 RNA methyltransferase [Gemmatimonadota bacterium]
MDPITSSKNPRVKSAVRLRDRRARRREGRFLVEGSREIARALDAGFRAETLFAQEKLVESSGLPFLVERAAACGARVIPVAPSVFAKLAIREESDGLVAVFPIPDPSPERLRPGAAPLLLAASGIEKPGNLGALLRSADAFAVDALLVEGGSDLWGPNVVRASLGCLFTVAVAAFEDGALFPWLKERGVRMVAVTPDGDTPLPDADLTGAVAVVVGNEQSGISREVREAADVRVAIPMGGAADSLNVSVCAGIVLYEATRQRGGGAKNEPGGPAVPHPEGSPPLYRIPTSTENP